MQKKPKGRPPESKKARDNADRVFVKLAIARELTRMSGLGGLNPFSEKRLTRQHRAPLLLTKQVLPQVANEIRKIEKVDNFSARTLERHYYEHGRESLDRIVAEIREGLKANDKADTFRREENSRRTLAELFAKKDKIDEFVALLRAILRSKKMLAK